jgi:hypothetical protein
MGSLRWQGAGKNVASPVAVRPQAVVAPANLAFTSEGGTGEGGIPVVSGTNAPVKITLDGLSKADSSAIELVPGPLALGTDESNFAKEVTVPAGSPLAKFSVYSADDEADFDLVVLNPAGQALLSQTASASESISVPNPAAGVYTIFVNLYASPNGQPTKASVDAAVLAANVGNATVTPNPLRLGNGQAGILKLQWKGLAEGSYIGRLTFAGSSVPTFVSVAVMPGGTVVVPDDESAGDPADAEKKDRATKEKKKQELSEFSGNRNMDL